MSIRLFFVPLFSLCFVWLYPSLVLASNLVTTVQVQKDPTKASSVLARVHCQTAPVFQVYDAKAPHRVVLEFLATEINPELVQAVKALPPVRGARLETSHNSAGLVTRLIFDVTEGTSYDVRSNKTDVLLRMFHDQDSDDAWEALERSKQSRREAEAAKLRAAKEHAERLAKKAEQEKQQALKAQEEQRLAAEKARLAAEKARLAAKKTRLAAEKDHLAAQQRAEAAQRRAEADQQRAEAAQRRLAEEKKRIEAQAAKAEAARLEAERQRQAAEKRRRDAEKRAAAEAEAARQRKQESERLARENETQRQREQTLRKKAQAEASRLATEKKRAELEAQRAEQARQKLAEEKRLAAERAALAEAEKRALEKALRLAQQDAQRLSEQADLLRKQQNTPGQAKTPQAELSAQQTRDAALAKERAQLAAQRAELEAQKAQLAADQHAFKIASTKAPSAQKKRAGRAPKTPQIQKSNNPQRTQNSELGFGGAPHQQVKTTRKPNSLPTDLTQHPALPSLFQRIEAATPSFGRGLSADDDGRMVSPKEVKTFKLVHQGSSDVLRISIPGGARYSLNRRNSHSVVLTLWDSVIYQLRYLRAVDARLSGGPIRYLSPEVEGSLRSHVNIVIEHSPGAQIFAQGSGDTLSLIMRQGN